MVTFYQSTRDKSNKKTASQAILQGLAEDGGLFVPVDFPKVDLDFEKLKNASYQEIAELVLKAFFDDFFMQLAIGGKCNIFFLNGCVHTNIRIITVFSINPNAFFKD